MATTSGNSYAPPPDPPRYVAGGNVQAGRGVYLSRAADNELLELCRTGAFAYILTSRQMGKSSLMMETAVRLRDEGVRTAMVDLTALGTDPTREQWYREILVEIADQLAIETDAAEWWRENRQDLSIAQRFNRFLEEVVLSEVPGRVAIFIDEIDTTLRLDFTDDFFIAIRYFFNARAVNRALERLSFVLIGVAAPGDLIHDPALTPFNIGNRVDLTDFTFDEALPLVNGLGLPEQVLRRVLDWTGGHPYLTLRVFRSLQDAPLDQKTDIDRRIAELFFGDKSSQDSNLQFVRGMLTDKAPDKLAVLELYRDVRGGFKAVADGQDYNRTWLKLSGVVKSERGRLMVRNRIYRTVFTPWWARQLLPVNWPKRLTRVGVGLLLFLMVCAIPLAIWSWGRKGDAERAEALEKDRSRRLTEANRNLDLFRKTEETLRKEAQAARADAEEQRKIAEEQRDRADGLKEEVLARSLSDQSARLLNQSGDTELAGLLAIESLKRSPTDEGAQALRNSLVYLRKTRSLFGGGKPVWSMAFSPDSKRLVSVGGDDFARVYDVDTGKELLRLRHDGDVVQAVFSQDGQFVLTGSRDKTARVWDATTGRELRRLECGSELMAVAVSQHGLAGTGSQTSAQVWDLNTGSEVARLDHGQEVGAVAFSPGGRWFASGAWDGSLQVWNRVDGNWKALPKLPNRIVSLSFSPADERRLLVADENCDLEIIDVTTASVLAKGASQSPFPPPPSRAVFSPDGKEVLVYSSSDGASVWDDSLKPIFSAPAANVYQGPMSFSLDGRFLITALPPATLTIADVRHEAPGKVWARIPNQGRIAAIEPSPDGLLFAIGGQRASRILEIHPRRESALWSGLGNVIDMAFSADGRWAAIAGSLFTIVDLERIGDTLRPIASEAGTIALDRDGGRVAGASLGRLWVSDARTGQELGASDLTGIPVALAFSADSRRVFAGYWDSPLRAFEWATGKWSEEAAIDHVIAISGDGRLLAASPDDKTIRILEMDTKRQVSSLSVKSVPWQAAFSADGKLLLTLDNTLEPIARVWDLKSRQELGHASDFDRIRYAALSADGRIVATVTGNSVRFQLWRTNDVIKYACEIITRPLSRDEWNQYLPEDVYRGLETCPQFQSLKGK